MQIRMASDTQGRRPIIPRFHAPRFWLWSARKVMDLDGLLAAHAARKRSHESHVFRAAMARGFEERLMRHAPHGMPRG